MARYQVKLVYDGTGFRGFQKQVGARTVQSVVEEALLQLGWQGKSILAAGRTDTGVHAYGQVAAFDLDWGHSEGDLLRALNANLPEDVAVRDAKQAGESFHPRYDAVSRLYQYHVFCHPVRDPLRERFAWRVWPALDIHRMQQAAGFLLGRHDFASFGSPPRVGGSTVRTVYQAGWQEAQVAPDSSLLTFEIAADAFLYHMVRRIVFLLVEVGQSLRDILEVKHCVDGVERCAAQGLAPAHGLILTSVRYDQPVL